MPGSKISSFFSGYLIFNFENFSGLAWLYVLIGIFAATAVALLIAVVIVIVRKKRRERRDRRKELASTIFLGFI